MTTETITIDEIGELLRQITARDQRTTGDADIVTWWNDLNTARVTYRAAQAAVNLYYAVEWPRQDERDRFRMTAPKVIELVGKLERERLEGFVYDPDPEETGAEYVANRHRQQAAVAAGHRPAALPVEGLHRRPVAELVAGTATARVLPPEVADVVARRRPPGSSITCPACQAAPGARCRTSTGRALSGLHPGRVSAWATQSVPCPTCLAPLDAKCTEYGHERRDGAHHARIQAATASPDPS